MHLGKDSSCPPLAPGTRRLYLMRFCPYCERVRLAFSLKGIKVEQVNIKLKAEKPDWYLKINPKGSVPCLILEDGSTLADSAEIVEWADRQSEAEPKFSLTTDDEKAKHNKLMGNFQALLKPWHELMSNSEADKQQLISQITQAVNIFEQDMTESYILGDDLKLTDLLLFPWFERLEIMYKMAALTFPATDFRKISAYIERMRSLEVLRDEFIKTETYYKYALTSLSGKPDYDIV